MSIKRLFDAVERRGDIGRRVAALALPISNRPRVTSSCAGKIGLREPGEHTSGPNLASRDNVAHNQNLYTILEPPPPVIPLCRKQARMREPMIPVNKLSTSGIDEHWHKCADEARSVADDMKDEISKQMMLQIADDYERLAKRAAHREPGVRLIG